MTPRGRRPGALVAALALGAVVAIGACYDDVKVVQGTVASVDEQGLSLQVRDERPPHATAAYRLKEAVTVAPGDLVRIAFRHGPDARTVVRVMNLTRHREKRQRERK